MKCPKCGARMEFEEVKFPSIVWFCAACEYEQDGEVDMGERIDEAMTRFGN